MPPYKSLKIDCDVDFETGRVKNRVTVVTGGSNGLGEGYVRALVKAGGYAVIGDIDETGGQLLASEFPQFVRFVRCDVTKWADQLVLFKEAVAFSPKGTIDVVIANAGIGGTDSFLTYDPSQEEPEEPNLKTTYINTIGVLYTVKLALHYFHRQHDKNKDLDQVLILGGSMSGYLDTPGALEYGAAKHGLRSLMTNLRHTEWQHNIRVAFVGPWFVETKIMHTDIIGYLKSRGAQFATVEDAATAVLRIICDPAVTGRTFAILPRTLAPRGYQDVDCDDPPAGHILNKLQREYNGSVQFESVPSNE